MIGLKNREWDDLRTNLEFLNLVGYILVAAVGYILVFVKIYPPSGPSIIFSKL